MLTFNSRNVKELTREDYKNIIKTKRNEVKQFLRHFDLQPIFGNYVGLTRIERYQRAISMALLDDIYYHYYSISKQQQQKYLIESKLTDNTTLSEIPKDSSPSSPLLSILEKNKTLKKEMISQFPINSVHQTNIMNTINKRDTTSIINSNNNGYSIEDINKLIEQYQNKLSKIYTSSLISQHSSPLPGKKKKGRNRQNHHNKKIFVYKNPDPGKDNISIQTNEKNKFDNKFLNPNVSFDTTLDPVYENYGGFWPPQPVQAFLENSDPEDTEIRQSIYYRAF